MSDHWFNSTSIMERCPFQEVLIRAVTPSYSTLIERVRFSSTSSYTHSEEETDNNKIINNIVMRKREMKTTI